MAAEFQVVRFNPEEMFPDLPLGLAQVAAFLRKAKFIHPLSPQDINRASFGQGFDEIGSICHLDPYDLSGSQSGLPPSASFLAVREEVCKNGKRYTYLPVTIGSVLPMSYALDFECKTSCARKCPELELTVGLREVAEETHKADFMMPHSVRPVIKLAAHDLMAAGLVPYSDTRFPLYALPDAFSVVACVVVERGQPSLYPYYINLGTQRINARHKETRKPMVILSPLHAFARRDAGGIKSDVFHGWVEGYEYGAAGTKEHYEALRDYGHSIADQSNGKFVPIPRPSHLAFNNLRPVKG